jgi:septum formation protein
MSREKIILASASPRRKELLAAMGVPFEVVTAEMAELDEKSAPGMAPVQIALKNAYWKAEVVAAKRPGCWVLGADTVVTLGHRTLGKPASLEQANEFLSMLSGREHDVVTACALIEPKGKAEMFHEVTKVVFRSLSPEVIERYLAAVHVLDKAGAYALQEHGDWIIERVDGSRSNVIGLPTEKLESVFKSRGLL